MLSHGVGTGPVTTCTVPGPVTDGSVDLLFAGHWHVERLPALFFKS